MDSQKQQASERIKQASNILVTVSSNPSVDQLAALVGLTVSLNKMGKHATAVFSGEVPSTLEFLQPEKTIEKNTDSLRDFIIALDKSKADKLRYKVEDRVVKIFITPYRTSITGKDLEFSQGDFNVDVVVALGVHNQAELDHAITSHGRILHDATIVTLNTKAGGELGSINWVNPNVSSLSELAVELVNALDKSLVDGQIATAFLTGIVAETERFSNAKTTPQTMTISAQLMSSGANQQLVATQLEEPVEPPMPVAAPIAIPAAGTPVALPPPPVKKSGDGTLEIAHDETKRPEEEMATEDHTAEPQSVKQPLPEPEPLPEPTIPAPQITIDEHGSLAPVVDSEEDLLPPVNKKAPEISHHNEAPKMVVEPPTLGSEASAGNPGNYGIDEGAGLPGMPVKEPEQLLGVSESTYATPPTMPLGDTKYVANAPGTSFLGDQPLLSDTSDTEKNKTPSDEHDKTLSEIEREVHSSHQVEPTPVPGNIPTPATIPIISPTDPEPAFNTEAILPPVQDAFTPNQPQESDTSIPNMPVPSPVQPTEAEEQATNVDDARNAVSAAMNADVNQPLGPIKALNANPGLQLNHPTDISDPVAVPDLSIPSPQAPVKPWTPTADEADQPVAPVAAPPSAPPPMMPNIV